MRHALFAPRFRVTAMTAGLAVLLAGCGAGVAAAGSKTDSIVAEVARVHQGAGPFAVAGYRMGARALREFALPHGSWDLEVVHRAPAQVQWSCIADGAQASTGASVGRLNLARVDAPRDATETFVRDRRTGRVLSFRLADAFLQRFTDTPVDQLAAAGRAVAELPDDQVFVMRELSADEARAVPPASTAR